MSKHELAEDEMREEYDFSHSVRAPYAAMAGEVHIVTLDPDVKASFPDSQSVNEALRLLIKAAKSAQELPKSTQELAKAS
jgi:hypothetical protein